MNIIGISCFYHDASACVIKDGKIIAAAQEERFNRDKYSQSFPINAINFCLQQADLTIYDVDAVAFYEKPFLKLNRVLLNHIFSYPFSLRNFLETMSGWLQDRLILPLKLETDIGYKKDSFFVKHHLAHAASSFFCSGYDEAALMTCDGAGEWAVMTLGHAKGKDITITKEMRYPDSIGLLYSIVTTYLGFRVFSGEGKVMGLASYGNPVYLDKFKEIVRVKDDGSFFMDRRYFSFNRGNKMYSKEFVKMFGAQREAESSFEQRHYDIAATLQKFIEDLLIKNAQLLYDQTKSDCLCLAGGVFLNCVANHKILENTSFKKVFVQPASGDSGAAIGAALYMHSKLTGQKPQGKIDNVFLGPEYTDRQIQTALNNSQMKYDRLEEDILVLEVAKHLSQNKVVGWMQGRMEFGPRALGNRSILANPLNIEMKDILNERIKKRESFRPFASAVIAEKSEEYFKLSQKSPYMLLACDTIEDKKKIIPSGIHVDGSVRVQTVTEKDNPLFYKVIKAFESITDIPVIINTSFNLRGEPMVCSPTDAIACFKKSDMDILVIGNYIVRDK